MAEPSSPPKSLCWLEEATDFGAATNLACDCINGGVNCRDFACPFSSAAQKWEAECGSTVLTTPLAIVCGGGDHSASAALALGDEVLGKQALDICDLGNEEKACFAKIQAKYYCAMLAEKLRFEEETLATWKNLALVRMHSADNSQLTQLTKQEVRALDRLVGLVRAEGEHLSGEAEEQERKKQIVKEEYTVVACNLIRSELNREVGAISHLLASRRRAAAAPAPAEAAAN